MCILKKCYRSLEKTDKKINDHIDKLKVYGEDLTLNLSDDKIKSLERFTRNETLNLSDVKIKSLERFTRNETLNNKK